MKRALAFVALAACGGHKQPPGAEADKLWDLAPEGTQGGLVMTAKGFAAAGAAIDRARALLDAPDLRDVKPDIDQLVNGRTLPTAIFAFGGKAIAIYPAGAPHGDLVCKDTRGVVACSKDGAQLEKLGTGSLRGKVAFVGDRGDIELYAPHVAPFAGSDGELAIVAHVDGGTLDLRGRWRGKPDGLAGLLAGASAPVIDPNGASGFLRANIAGLLPEAGEQPIAAGVTTDKLAKSLSGPIRLIVPAGSIDLQATIPLADPGPASTLVQHCDELPLMRPAQQPSDGSCRVAIELASPLELDTWVANKELHVASHRSQPTPPGTIPPTAIGRELATGEWSIAFWGRGTMFNTTGVAPASEALSPPAARAIHLMALLDELGAGFAFERDGVRFRVYARTVFANAPELAQQLATIDGDQIARGSAIAPAKALADGAPSSPFAADFAAGQGGLMIPAALAGIAAAVALPRIAELFEEPAAPPEPPKPMDQAQLTKLLVGAYAEDAIPRWYAENPKAPCPSIDDLAKYLHVAPDIPTTTDPWGNRLVVRCDGKSMIVHSVGPDGHDGTFDDISP